MPDLNEVTDFSNTAFGIGLSLSAAICGLGGDLHDIRRTCTDLGLIMRLAQLVMERSYQEFGYPIRVVEPGEIEKLVGSSVLRFSPDLEVANFPYDIYDDHGRFDLWSLDEPLANYSELVSRSNGRQLVTNPTELISFAVGAPQHVIRGTPIVIFTKRDYLLGLSSPSDSPIPLGLMMKRAPGGEEIRHLVRTSLIDGSQQGFSSDGCLTSDGHFSAGVRFLCRVR